MHTADSVDKAIEQGSAEDWRAAPKRSQGSRLDRLAFLTQYTLLVARVSSFYCA